MVMTIIRDVRGRFAKGNSYWLGRKGKKPNSGSFTRGAEPWNKGRRTYKKCERCQQEFTTNRGNLTRPHQRFCSIKCATWINGNTPLKKKIWSSKEARQWRASIRKRDKVCVRCGANKKLHCDHIKPKSLYPEQMFDIDNGRLLCFDCHKKTPTYGSKL
jgi:5-methylcytosine-specific restriction endonuclease McrA